MFFRNFEEVKDGNNTPIPVVIFWLYIEKYGYNNYEQPLNADFCNRVFNNELKDFFEKHPEEIGFTFVSILEAKKEYYKKELGYLLEEE